VNAFRRLFVSGGWVAGGAAHFGKAKERQRYNAPVRRCIVSIRGKDNQEHSIETEAESLFGAAYAGVQVWSKLWWFSSDSVIQVRDGTKEWCVEALRATAWYAQRFGKQ